MLCSLRGGGSGSVCVGQHYMIKFSMEPIFLPILCINFLQSLKFSAKITSLLKMPVQILQFEPTPPPSRDQTLPQTAAMLHYDSESNISCDIQINK